jgi:hypothetical protein
MLHGDGFYKKSPPWPPEAEGEMRRGDRGKKRRYSQILEKP